MLRNRLRNLLHAFLLISGMALLLAACVELLFGEQLWLWAFGGVALSLLAMPRLPTRWTLGMLRAVELGPSRSPRLSMLIDELAARAGLPRAPALYWLPSNGVNAFALGDHKDAAIAISDGMLRLLSLRELKGVLAHEISHIKHHDTRLMTLADLINRQTHLMALVGLLLVLINLPLLLLGLMPMPLAGLGLLIAAPLLSALLQLALARSREFDADLAAAQLTGDAAGLASALNKIERLEQAHWRRLLLPGYPQGGHNWLRTHPPSGQRIRRLLGLHVGNATVSAVAPREPELPPHAAGRSPHRSHDLPPPPYRGAAP